MNISVLIERKRLLFAFTLCTHGMCSSFQGFIRFNPKRGCLTDRNKNFCQARFLQIHQSSFRLMSSFSNHPNECSARVALLQFHVSGDKARNIETASEFLIEAKKHKAVLSGKFLLGNLRHFCCLENCIVFCITVILTAHV